MFLIRASQKPAWQFLAVTIVCSFFLCSCVTQNSNHCQLPADVTMNQNAGRGGWLIVMLRLESGQKMPFILDTGTFNTLFDKSLVPELGKPIGKISMWHWGQEEESALYAMPKLYLGNIPLIMSGSNTAAIDLKDDSGSSDQSFMGILGMDVLEHYCVQFDFAAGKIRFLDDQKADKKNWGRAFPIVALNANDARPSVAENLSGTQGPHSLIDSGYLGDGWLMREHFQLWTNSTMALTNGEVHSPEGRFGGEKYPEISLDFKDVESDGVGLNFLARHLVTFDFPNRTMYLKRTSKWPLANQKLEAEMKSEIKPVIKLLKALKDKNQLPGWSKNEEMAQEGDFHYFPPDSATAEGRKKSDPTSVYHYQLIRASKNSSWKLHKAWRTDDSGKVLEEFPVP